jgi:purine-nucleoside phosphorylase
MNDLPVHVLVQQAVTSLASRLPCRPTVGIILGSGLGSFAERPPVLAAIPYAEIPGFPVCSVEGHAGRLVLTRRHGHDVAILQGRGHRYEGFSLQTVAHPVRVLAGLGATTLIVTCAVGSLGEAEAGDLMLIEDHVNLMGDNPLINADREAGGFVGFVEMADAYDPTLLALAERAAESAAVPIRRGILASVAGPAYETTAEAAMLRRLGAQAVSMSVVPEVIVARSLNLRVLGLALVTNRAGMRIEGRTSGRPGRPLGHHDVVAVAEARSAAVGLVLDGVLSKL